MRAACVLLGRLVYLNSITLVCMAVAAATYIPTMGGLARSDDEQDDYGEESDREEEKWSSDSEQSEEEEVPAFNVGGRPLIAMTAVLTPGSHWILGSSTSSRVITRGGRATETATGKTR